MIKSGIAGQRPTRLNLQQEWNPAGRVSGMAGVVITTFPQEASAAARDIRNNGGYPRPETVAATILKLDATAAQALFDGPNHCGAARRWISPQQAAEACRLTAEGRARNEIWPTVDRAKIHEAAETEKPTQYDRDVVEHRLNEWERAEAEQDWHKNATSEKKTDARKEAREWSVEQRAEETRRDLINPGAIIDPTARIERNVEIEDRTHIGSNCQIKSNTKISNDTTIDKNCTIEPGCRIGRHVTIGHGTTIGEGTTIGHKTTIGEKCKIEVDVTIAENAAIGDSCTVGEATKIDDSARIDRKTRIGSDVVIQQKATVGQEGTIEDRSRIGIGTRIGDRVHIANDVQTDWQCNVGSDAKLQTRAKLEPYARVAAGTEIAAGARVKGSSPETAQPVIRGAGRPPGGGTPQANEPGRDPRPNRG